MLKVFFSGFSGSEGELFDITLDSMLRETRDSSNDTPKAQLTRFLKFKDENNIVIDDKESERTDEEGSTSSQSPNDQLAGVTKGKLKRTLPLEEISSQTDLGWLINFSAAKLFKPSLQDMTNQSTIRTSKNFN